MTKYLVIVIKLKLFKKKVIIYIKDTEMNTEMNTEPKINRIGRPKIYITEEEKKNNKKRLNDKYYKSRGYLIEKFKKLLKKYEIDKDELLTDYKNKTEDELIDMINKIKRKAIEENKDERFNWLVKHKINIDEKINNITLIVKPK